VSIWLRETPCGKHWCRIGRTYYSNHFESPRENIDGWCLEGQNLWHAQCAGRCSLFLTFKSFSCGQNLFGVNMDWQCGKHSTNWSMYCEGVIVTYFSLLERFSPTINTFQICQFWSCFACMFEKCAKELMCSFANNRKWSSSQHRSDFLLFNKGQLTPFVIVWSVFVDFHVLDDNNLMTKGLWNVIQPMKCDHEQVCKIKYIHAWSICRATLKFSRTLNLCPKKKKDVCYGSKVIWLKDNHRGVYKIIEKRGLYNVLLLKARMLVPSHGDRN